MENHKPTQFFHTTDNNCGQPFLELCDTEKMPHEISAVEKEKFSAAFRHLSNIANSPLGELVEQNQSLFVFPQSFSEHNDEIDKQPIFSMSGSEDDFSNVKITTGNIMGFAGCGGTQIEITSRFTENENAEDFFLHYMLAKVFSLNLFDLKHLSGDGQFDFLIYLFPYFLQKALSQGMFRTYQFFARNDANIKGAPDVSRHIKQNVPFAGRIAYNSRERSFDNNITQLVRHTIEAIKIRPNGKAVLSKSEEIRRSVAQIVQATPTYNMQDRNKIIAQNEKPLAHPFFTHWRTLQKVCLAILHNQKLKYGQTKNQIYGILFDGAWLWEEYLATVLKGTGFIHAENRTGKNPISLWSGNPRYPDFYKEKQNPDFRYGDEIPEENCILDAKYKPLDKHSISREDVHQIVTYMHILPARRAGLIYPHKPNDEDFSTEQKTFTVRGMGGTVSVFGLKIPQDSHTQEKFAQEMEAEERKLHSASVRGFPALGGVAGTPQDAERTRSLGKHPTAGGA